MIPFSKDVFLIVVERYAAAMQPSQVIAFLMGCAMVDMVRRPRASSSRMICFILAAAWFWIGTVYYGSYMAGLSWAAWIAAAAFILQAALLLIFGTVRNCMALHYERNLTANTGLGLMLYGLFVYPATAVATGIELVSAPVIGLAPDSTLLFTLGVLLIAKHRTPLLLAAIAALVMTVMKNRAAA